MLTFRWLGAAGFELQCDGSTLLVDPFLTRPPLYKLWLGRTRPDGARLRRHLPQADAILVSHAHYDHLLDVAEIARYTGAEVYGSPHTCQLVAAGGLRDAQIRHIQAGDCLWLPGFPAHLPLPGEVLRDSGVYEVQVLAGAHAPLPGYGPGRLPERLQYPLRLRDFVLDETFSFLIQAGLTRLLAWHNHRPSPAPRAEVLLLLPDVASTDLPALLEQVQPGLVIPLHWDDFFRPLEKPLRRTWRIPTRPRPRLQRADPWALKRLVEQARPGVEVWVPELLAPFTL